jgi:hypothetical protein
MTGLSFYEMLKTEYEDENGEKHYIPIDVARRFSVGTGILSGLIEAAQFDLLTGTPITKTVFRNGIMKMLANPKNIEMSVKVGAGFLKTYGVNVASEVLEELSQEAIEFTAYNAAVAAANERNASLIPQREFDEFAQQLKQVIFDTAVGYSILGVPGSIGQVRGAVRARQQGLAEGQKIMNLVNGQPTEELINAVQTGDREAFQAEIGKILNDNPITNEDISIERTERGFSAKVRNTEVGTYSVEVEGNVFRFGETTANGLFSNDEMNYKMAVSAANLCPGPRDSARSISVICSLAAW